ncbi:hypothetical protein [Deinococcus betulae]
MSHDLTPVPQHNPPHQRQAHLRPWKGLLRVLLLEQLEQFDG